MPVLSIVHPWPAQGRADRPTDEDDVADVAIRGCRSVAELYGETLRQVGLVNRVTELRIFHRHDPALEDVRATVQVDRAEGFEMAHVFVPTAFADRTPRVRGEILLDAVHGLVRRLALARGWDPGALEACRQHVLDHDLEYRWRSEPTSSPDRRLAAHAEFRLPPDGYGRVRLVVVRREDGEVVARSEEGLAFATREGFVRAARSLRWSGRDRVSLVPYDWVPAVRGGLVSLTREDDGWRSAVEDHLAVRPVPAGDPTLPPLAVHVEGRGANAAEQPARISFVGGGPVQTPSIERFLEAFGREMDRFASPAGQEWWQDAGIRLLDVQITFQRAESRVRGRRAGERLAIWVDQADASLPSGDPAPLARQVAEQVVTLVRRRTGLGPHPELGG